MGKSSGCGVRRSLEKTIPLRGDAARFGAVTEFFEQSRAEL
jgi:hypothetical protein